MPAFTDHDLQSLATLIARWGFPAIHARRLMRGYYAQNGSWAGLEAKTGPALCRRLADEAPLRQSRIARRHRSADGTVKLLVQFDRGGAAECVLMPGYRDDRAAACVSSQIGCAMGCDFCASTLAGLERNLSAGEMAEQYLHLKAEATNLGRRLTSLVFMGMGEPLANLDNLIPGINRIADPDMGGLGWRQVTVSTVGLVPGIDRLAEAGLNVHLALSLHAPDDELRSRLVPPNRRHPIADLLAATRRFYARTNRIPTVQYCLLDGINDADEHALALAGLLRGLKAHVNLIPYNAIGAGVSGVVYRPSPAERVVRFLELLRDRGVVAHRRDPRGQDVDAACGQLQLRATSQAGPRPL